MKNNLSKDKRVRSYKNKKGGSKMKLMNDKRLRALSKRWMINVDPEEVLNKREHQNKALLNKGANELNAWIRVYHPTGTALCWHSMDFQDLFIKGNSIELHFRKEAEIEEAKVYIHQGSELELIPTWLFEKAVKLLLGICINSIVSERQRQDESNLSDRLSMVERFKNNVTDLLASLSNGIKGAELTNIIYGLNIKINHKYNRNNVEVTFENDAEETKKLLAKMPTALLELYLDMSEAAVIHTINCYKYGRINVLNRSI